jgi:hypothetical protein
VVNPRVPSARLRDSISPLQALELAQINKSASNTRDLGEKRGFALE